MSVDSLHPPLRLGAIRLRSTPALVITLAVLVICALPLLFTGTRPLIELPNLPWHHWFGISEVAREQYGSLGGPFTHTILLLLGGTVAFCGALLSFARSTVRRSALTSVISIALFWAAFVSFSQVITAESSFVLDLETARYITFTGFVTRAVIALLLTLGGILLLVPGKGRFIHRTNVLLALFLFFGALSIAFIWLALTLELPQTIFSEQIIKRPYDLPALALLVLCNTALFPRLHAHYQSYFSFALWLSTIALIASQLYLIFGSKLVFDDLFNIAYALQFLAFFILFGGLVWDYARSTGEEIHLLELLQIRETRLRAMFFSASDAIVAVGDQDQIELWNPAAAELFGYDVDEAVGQNMVELLIPADLRPQFQDHVRRLSSTQSGADNDSSPSAPLELIMNHRKGAALNILATVDPAGGDEAWRYMLIARDLTERKRMERRLIQMDRMITVGTLAAGVGHEIKNPLSFVMGNLELALESLTEEQPDLDELKADLDAAQVGAKRIHRIVDDLKMMSGFQSEPLRRICLNDALHMALRMTKHQIQGRAVLRQDLADHVFALADEGRLTQVIINLLLNASHAMPTRPRDQNKIVLRLFTAEDQAIIEVDDNGAGIPHALQHEIFEPFFTTKARGEGTGLGLSLSRQIITSFHGELSLESTPGEGTTFRISLPLLD